MLPVAPPRPVRDISTLVESMFADVFTDDERTILLERIREWERENPDVGQAQRVTGWIDVAYAYQEHLDRTDEPPSHETKAAPAATWALRQA